ncbi:hypothetical protein ABIG06_006857 [Bradyrhizobium sp. USDA 326]|uniref:hypothetical protein n=1 Tax=Bradyrhizobium sp. USDA 326 TaxID=3377726 RepID=UPI003C745A46
MTTRNPSRNRSGAKSSTDLKGASQESIIEDSEELKEGSRDLVHGEGGTIDLPTKPGDLSRDD